MKPPSPKKTFARTVYYGAMIAIPFDVAGESNKFRIAEELTVTPLQHSVSFGKPEFDDDGNAVVVDPTPIKQFYADLDDRMLYVPWTWGVRFLEENCGGFTIIDKRSQGSEISVAKFPDPNHPNATPGQGEFFANILHQIGYSNTILIEAPTGGGKTVAMLNTIGKLGRTALVIVPSKSLADQWRLEAIKHLDMTEEDISIMQGSALNWRGKKIVIAVIHNMFLKEFTQEFYDAFGTVCWDEAHRLGAPEFSKTMKLFNAKYRIAATATPNRKDGCMALVHNHFGQVAVKMDSDALATDCYVVRYSDPFAHKISHLPPPTILTILVKNKARNEMGMEIVKTAWKRGRCVLVLSDRIEHLQTLQTMLVKMGVPHNVTALYVGSHGPKGKRKTTGQGYLRTIREDPKFQVIFATYSMMKEGTDIPRMSAGIDMTPRADGIQAIGRIRRPLPGKAKPVWFTIVDTQIPIFAAYSKARLRDYASKNVTIIDNS